ncbi:MAG: Gfo/Idh/MocA family oxidoreductase [Pirellulales bacterium]|nr:Gfo/Idh/MocA family oxidoreductase [Pirellulales bacterium]
MPHNASLSRRRFLKTIGRGATAVSAGFWTGVAPAAPGPSGSKLNIGCVGTAGRAAADINQVQTENIVALCDIDLGRLRAAKERFPDARTYVDYREMLEAEGDKIDAVVIGTPDHSHAPATIRAIRAGKHVYCEKPLSHTVHEARLVAEAAQKYSVVTQLGTQVHAEDNYRRVVEVIRSGTIGGVTDVHVWCGKNWGYRQDWEGSLSGKGELPPELLNWDLWLGPATNVPYWPGRFHPAQWRRWWLFGQGTLGDMACHFMDLPFWALGLRHPVLCEAEGPEVHPEMCPIGLTVRYKFPGTGGGSPVNLTWYDGQNIPKEINGQAVPPNGVMFVGSDGMLFSDYGGYRLFGLSESDNGKFVDFQPPEPTIPKSIGHHAEWIKACKDGSPTTCNFDYSGALTEAVLLGNVAYRTGARLEWDAEKLEATNCPAAAQYVRKDYRPGWEIS